MSLEITQKKSNLFKHLWLKFYIFNLSQVLQVLERSNSTDKDSDSEHTPQAEMPPRQIWSDTRPGTMSLELDDDKVCYLLLLCK